MENGAPSPVQAAARGVTREETIVGNDDSVVEPVKESSSTYNANNLLELTVQAALEFGYPIGCPVWCNFRYEADGLLHFSTGRIARVRMNSATRKLVSFLM